MSIVTPVHGKVRVCYCDYALTTQSPPSQPSPVAEPPPSLLPQLSSVAPVLLSPEAGVSEVPVKPLFQWSAMAGAEGYELIVSTDVSFTSPTIVRIGDYALPATAWQSNINLNYNTAYYWKVRAVISDGYSDWSAVSVFTTQSSLSQPSLVAEPSPSASPPPGQSTLPDWLIYLTVALLLTTVLLLITLLVVTIRRSRTDRFF